MVIELWDVKICEQVIVSLDGKITIVNIFSNINTRGFPAVHPKFCILTNIKGPEGNHKEIIEIVSPSGKVIGRVEGNAEIKGEGGNNFVANFINIAFMEEGKYWVKVSIDGQILTKDDEYVLSTREV